MVILYWLYIIGSSSCIIQLSIVGEVVGIEFVMVFNDAADFDGGDREFQQADVLVYPFVGDMVPFQRCFDALSVLQMVGTAVYFAGSFLPSVFVGRGVVGDSHIGVGYALGLQYFDAHPMLGH